RMSWLASIMGWTPDSRWYALRVHWTWVCSVILSEASLRAKSKDPHLVASSAWVADPSQAQDDIEPVGPETYGTLYSVVRDGQDLADAEAIGVGDVVVVDDLPDADLVLRGDVFELIASADHVGAAFLGW